MQAFLLVNIYFLSIISFYILYILYLLLHLSFWFVKNSYNDYPHNSYLSFSALHTTFKIKMH